MADNLLVADNVARVKFFAVAIKKFDHNSHAGVLFVGQGKSERQGKLWLMHLGEPGELAIEKWDESWGWCAVHALKREELRQLAVLCDYVSDAKEQIPYGFKYSSATRFTRDGRLTLADGHKGLTCSTFVLALLASYEIILLDFATWPERSEDEKWFR